MPRTDQQNRFYRNLLQQTGLVNFRVVVKETDLFIHAQTDLQPIARELVLQFRGYIEAYIQQYPAFGQTLKPWHLDGPAPQIIKDMSIASELSGVGPMASVAGAIAEHVGNDLLLHTEEVIVENGGDIFLRTKTPVTVGIYAGSSPLSLRVGLRMDCGDKPIAMCTSSGKIGHSLSLGNADAVCVASESCALADAVATSAGNRVHSKADIPKAIKFGKKIDGVIGLAVIVDDELGLWGELEIVPLEIKKS
jgi:ApbE superfamily uncharacterized protein (UPF0280 family)